MIVIVDEDDLSFILDALKDFTNDFKILPFQSSEAFVDYIVSAIVLPVLVVLDYNMPRWNAEDILIKMKSTQRLASVKTFILSTGMSPDLKKRLLSLGANCCIAKPSNHAEYKPLAQDIIQLATLLQSAFESNRS